MELKSAQLSGWEGFGELLPVFKIKALIIPLCIHFPVFLCLFVVVDNLESTTL